MSEAKKRPFPPIPWKTRIAMKEVTLGDRIRPREQTISKSRQSKMANLRPNLSEI